MINNYVTDSVYLLSNRVDKRDTVRQINGVLCNLVSFPLEEQRVFIQSITTDQTVTMRETASPLHLKAYSRQSQLVRNDYKIIKDIFT